MEKKYFVLKYPLYAYTINEVSEIYNGLKRALIELDPNCHLIAIPHDWEALEMSIEELIKERELLDRIIGEQKDDIDRETGTRS